MRSGQTEYGVRYITMLVGYVNQVSYFWYTLSKTPDSVWCGFKHNLVTSLLTVQPLSTVMRLYTVGPSGGGDQILFIGLMHQ